MSRKKILIFSTAYFPFVGGAEVSVWEITNRLTGEYDFHLITARLDKNLSRTENIGAVTVHRIGFGIPLLDKLILPFWGAIKTIRLQRSNSYIAYWCIMVTFASGAAFIANWFQKKVPIVLTLQEGDSEDWLRYRWFGLLDLSWRLALKRTDHLTGLSHYLLERAKRLGFRGRATLVPNGVEVKRFIPTQPKIFNKEKIILITTSRLTEKNAVADVIEAMTLLPESVHFQIAGIGPLESQLRSQVKRLGLGKRVEFVGFVPQVELPEHLHKADIFIRPSLSEGQGISFIEAMAAGLPIIATPVGGIVDFLRDGETGLFCEPENPESIAKAVKRLIEDTNLHEKLIENGQKLVKEKYDWDLIANKMKARVFDPAIARQVR